MIHFYKYEFSSEANANKLINKLTAVDCSVIKLGHLMISPETYTKGGKSRNDAIISKKYSVDVVWNEPEHKDWTWYKITLGAKPSSHEIAGVKYYE